MQIPRPTSASSGSRCPRRVLLVGLPSLKADLLERHLLGIAEVTTVSFPGRRFDSVAEQLRPDLVVVDLTYLDGSVVRPLITHRFLDAAPLVVYLSDRHGDRYEDLRTLDSGELSDATLAGLVRVASGSPIERGAEE